jgi:hypothetical protein
MTTSMNSRNRLSRRRRNTRRSSGSRGFTNPVVSFGAFNTSQPYLFRLCQLTTIMSNGSGVAAGYIFNDPSSTMANFSEHVNYLANLFTEFRIVRSRWTVISNISGLGDTKGDYSPMAIGVYNRTSSSLPSVTNANQVLDNQPSWLYNLGTDTSPCGKVLASRFPGVMFQLVTTTSTDYAGAPGGLVYYASGCPFSANILQVKQEVWLQYRGRA